MNIILYGLLRKGEKAFFLIPSKRGKMNQIKLRGYKMYDRGSAPAVIKGNKNDEIIVEFWRFSLNRLRNKLLLFFLDIFEGVPFGTYRREKIKTPKGMAWIYIYNKSVKGYKRIKNWKNLM